MLPNVFKLLKEMKQFSGLTLCRENLLALKNTEKKSAVDVFFFFHQAN